MSNNLNKFTKSENIFLQFAKKYLAREITKYQQISVRIILVLILVIDNKKEIDEDNITNERIKNILIEPE